MGRRIEQEVYYLNRTGDVWLKLDNVTYPITMELALNEEFDYATLKFYSFEKMIFQPKDKVIIRTMSYTSPGVAQTDKLDKFIVHEDLVNQASIAFGDEYYEHNLRLVEMTQILQSYTVENKSFSRTINRARLPIIPQYQGWEAPSTPNACKIYIKDSYMIYENYSYNSTVILPDAVEYQTRSDVTTIVSTSYTIEITEPNATITTLQYNNREYTFDQLGIYNIKYKAGYDLGGSEEAFVLFENIYVDERIESYTIKEVIEKLFETTETLKLGETTQFELLDSATLNAKLDTPAPEFFFFNMSLWDALLEIGRFVMGIPRILNFNQLTFDFVGEIDETVDSNGYVSQTIYQTESQYITKVESDLDNIIVDSIEEQSEIVIPYNVPSSNKDNSVEISADTAVFKLDGPPIYKINELKVYVDWTAIEDTYYYDIDLSGTDEELDLTSFILEKGLWDSLPNTGTGKGIFLHYSQGKSDIIDGLSYQTPEWWFLKPETKTIDRLIRLALANKIGLDITDEVNANSVLTVNTNIQSTVFSAKYIPFMGQRVKSNRTNMEDFDNETTKFMNQISRQVDSESFGLYMKGMLDRQGNRNFNRTYFYKDYPDIPKAGSRDINNYFSTKISTETWPSYIKTSIEYTKDYNKQVEFVGLDQKYRQFQIPLDSVSNRTVNVEDYVIIAKDSETALGNNTSSLTTEGRNLFSGLFSKTNNSYTSTYAVSNGLSPRLISNDMQIFFDKDGVYTLPDVRLHKSLMSYHLGNSLIFTCTMGTNYTAGERSVYQNPSKNRVEQINYGDSIYSNAYMFRMRLLSNFDAVSSSKAMKFPEAETVNDSISGTPAITLDAVVNKDTRDSLIVTYQLSGVAYTKDIIIGPGFAKYNPLVNSPATYTDLKLITFDKLIGPHTKTIIESEGTIYLNPQLAYDLSSDTNKAGQGVFRLYTPTINELYNGDPKQSWALYHPDTKEIVLAVNEDIGDGVNASDLCFYFKRHKRDPIEIPPLSL